MMWLAPWPQLEPLRKACAEQAARLAPLLKPLRKEVRCMLSSLVPWQKSAQLLLLLLQVKCAYGGKYDSGLLSPSTGVLVCTAESFNSL